MNTFKLHNREEEKVPSVLMKMEMKILTGTMIIAVDLEDKQILFAPTQNHVQCYTIKFYRWENIKVARTHPTEYFVVVVEQRKIVMIIVNSNLFISPTV